MSASVGRKLRRDPARGATGVQSVRVPALTPERFRECVDFMADYFGWDRSGATLGRLLRLDERQVRRLYSGRATVPADVAAWIELIVQFHQANPPPEPPPR